MQILVYYFIALPNSTDIKTYLIVWKSENFHCYEDYMQLYFYFYFLAECKNKSWHFKNVWIPLILTYILK